MSSKPFSQACDNNKQPILTVLQSCFADRKRVLEIGSGTGQHAAFFAANLPHLLWQPSDVTENLPGIEQWRESATLDNLPPAMPFDVRDSHLPVTDCDAVFSANTLHIMAWPEVEKFFKHLAALASGSALCVYGPFNYDGRFTSDSNARFNQWLEQRNMGSAIRDFEAINELASHAGYTLQCDFEMPANNRLLFWTKSQAQ